MVIRACVRFRAFLGLPNRTKFRRFLPKSDRIWQKGDVFRDRFYLGTGRTHGLGATPISQTGAEHKLAGRPKASPRRLIPCRQAVAGFHERGRWLVTDMGILRKLTNGINRHFPLWKSHFCEESVLQTKRLLEAVSVFGRFLGYQIVPNFTNFYQFLPKTCSERPRTGRKVPGKGGFSRPILLNRVKSGPRVKR